MANAAICGINLALAGNVAASSQEILLAAQNLLDAHVETRWRSKTNSDFFVCDLLASASIDTIVVAGLTAGKNATIRVRLSSSDSTGASGDAYDSGSMTHGAGNFDADYAKVVCALAASHSARYVRVDITDPSATYVEAGKLFVGLRTAFTYNFGYGWQSQWVDRSTSKESRGGQTLIWRDNKYRTLQIDFKFVTTTQRYGIVEQIDRDNGIRDDVLIITDTASSNLARDSFLGLISSLTAVVQPDAVFDTDGPLYSKQYQLKERL